MKYEYAPDLQARMIEIVRLLGMSHVNVERVRCFRGIGSKAQGIIARCHSLGKLMQRAMGVDAFYAIEFLARFEKLSKQDKDKVIIHELMHVPKTFGGGFRHHDYVIEENVDVLYELLAEMEEKLGKEDIEGHITEKGYKSDYSIENFE